jgi:transcriptional antiterminator RfaH
MAYWACAQTVSRRESAARHFLQIGGYEAYLPLVREGQAKAVRPLFPGYLFVRIELQWSKAQWTVGVSRLILDGERPAAVPDQVVDALRRRERNGVVHLPRPPKYRRGDRLQVIEGSFSGQLALCEGMTPRDRVLVLLRLFGVQRTIELSQSAVESY